MRRFYTLTLLVSVALLLLLPLLLAALFLQGTAAVRRGVRPIIGTGYLSRQPGQPPSLPARSQWRSRRSRAPLSAREQGCSCLLYVFFLRLLITLYDAGPEVCCGDGLLRENLSSPLLLSVTSSRLPMAPLVCTSCVCCCCSSCLCCCCGYPMISWRPETCCWGGLLRAFPNTLLLQSLPLVDHSWVRGVPHVPLRCASGPPRDSLDIFVAGWLCSMADL